MYNIWCDHPLPSSCSHLLEDIAIAIDRTCTPPGAPMSIASELHAIIASSRQHYNSVLMDSAPMLKVISRMGVGIDNICITDATARGIAVCNTPEAPTISTGEHTIALMLAVTKHIKKSESVFQHGGQTNFHDEYLCLELHRRCLGLIGLGRIGSYVAKIALALGMVVVAYDPYVSTDRASDLGIKLIPDLFAMLQTADIVSLHAPYTSETEYLMNAERLTQMKPGSYLINTSRGKLIDEAALYEALDSGHIHGVGLDVFEKEPPDPSNPLLKRDDVVATPHIASSTEASWDRMWHMAITQALQVLQGEQPAYLVNPEVWPPE